jgi:O-antigen/teichoic acid export membrane protein
MDLFKRIHNSKFALNVIKLITGTALGQAIIVLASPVLTRIYSPSDFGILAIYISIVSIASVIISLRYESAIVLPKDEEKALDLVLLSLGIAFGFSLLLLLIAVVFNKPVTTLVDAPEFSFFLYLIPLSTFFYGSFQTLSFYHTRRQNFNQLAFSNTLKGFGTTGTQISYGLVLPPNALGLILGQIAGNALATFSLFHKFYRTILNRVRSDLPKNLKSVLIEYKLFPLFTSSTTFVNAIAQNMPALLLALLFSPKIAGFYAVSARVMMVPIALVGNSVRQVFYQRASELYNQGNSIFHLFKKMTINLTLIGILPTVIILIFGEVIFGMVLGGTWAEAGIYASIIALWQYLGFLNRPSVASLLILRLNHVQLIMDSIAVVLRLSALLVGALIFEDIYIALGLFTFVGIIFNLSLIAYVYFKLRQEHIKMAKDKG